MYNGLKNSGVEVFRRDKYFILPLIAQKIDFVQ